LSVKVVISGPRGKMGSKVYHRLKNMENVKVVGLLDYTANNDKAEKVYYKGEECFSEVQADVLIDFTNPEVSEPLIKSALNHGVKVISGTTGFHRKQLKEFEVLANQLSVGCVIAPNFALGAVFMMIFSQYAAKYFEHINIIEKHHEQKVDRPSGTAATIKQLIKENTSNTEPEVFSVRSVGYIAHHEVVFGGPGQILSIKHDSFNRQSFLEGLLFALREIKEINEYTFGLENVLRL